MRDGELEYIEHLKEAPMRLIIVSLETSSPHWHEEYEVVFVLRGAVAVNAGGRGSELKDGDVMLVNPRELHSFARRDGDNICLIMQFSPSVVSEVYDRAFNFRLNTADEDALIKPETAAALRKLLAETGLLLHDKPDGYQFSVKSGLYAFAGLLFRHMKYEPAEPRVSQNDEYLRDFDIIQRYIKTRFAEDIDLNQIGRALGMSRATVYRVLKAAGGASAKDMTNYYRVEYAKHQLTATARAIPAIAAESGFTSDSSFYRVFREFTGVPPREYRNSPARKTELTGIQGYRGYSVPESLTLLRGFAGL